MPTTRDDYPHLTWVVSEEHDGSGEIEKALNEIDTLRSTIRACRAEIVKLILKHAR